MLVIPVMLVMCVIPVILVMCVIPVMCVMCVVSVSSVYLLRLSISCVCLVSFNILSNSSGWIVYLPIHSNTLNSISLKRLSGSTCLTEPFLFEVFGVFGVFEVFKGVRLVQKVKQVFYDDPMLKYVFHHLIYTFYHLLKIKRFY